MEEIIKEASEALENRKKRLEKIELERKAVEEEKLNRAKYCVLKILQVFETSNKEQINTFVWKVHVYLHLEKLECKVTFDRDSMQEFDVDDEELSDVPNVVDAMLKINEITPYQTILYSVHDLLKDLEGYEVEQGDTVIRIIMKDVTICEKYESKE